MHASDTTKTAFRLNMRNYVAKDSHTCRFSYLAKFFDYVPKGLEQLADKLDVRLQGQSSNKKQENSAGGSFKRVGYILAARTTVFETW